LATIYYEQSKYTEAEPLFKRALAIDEKALGSSHLDLIGDKFPMLHRGAQRQYIDAEATYAKLLRKTDRKAEADRLDARAKII
jgi:tetratricopeptide (TPR) repeat protein